MGPVCLGNALATHWAHLGVAVQKRLSALESQAQDLLQKRIETRSQMPDFICLAGSERRPNQRSRASFISHESKDLRRYLRSKALFILKENSTNSLSERSLWTKRQLVIIKI